MTTNSSPPDPVALALSRCYAFLLARWRHRLTAQRRTEKESLGAGNFGEQAATGAQGIADEPQPTQS